jgi:hypothetical protein
LIKFRALDAISRAYGRGCLCIEWPDWFPYPRSL